MLPQVTHIILRIIDYNYAAKTGNQKLINALSSWEQFTFNKTPDFISQDKLVKVYKNEI